MYVGKGERVYILSRWRIVTNGYVGYCFVLYGGIRGWRVVRCGLTDCVYCRLRVVRMRRKILGLVMRCLGTII